MLISTLAVVTLQDSDAIGGSNAHLLMIFIGLAAFALLVQAVAMAILAVGAAKTQKRILADVDELKGKMMPLLDDLKAKMIPLIDKSSVLVTDLTPQLKQIAGNATVISGHVEDISALVLEKAHEFAPTISAANKVLEDANDTVKEANQMTHEQVMRVNGMVTGVLDATAQMGKKIQYGITQPVREVSGIVQGVKAAVSYFLNSSSKRKVAAYRAPVGTYVPTDAYAAPPPGYGKDTPNGVL